MDWVRGEVIGHGCFSTVNLATTSSSGRIAVKSADFADASFLKHEKQVLNDVGPHRNVIRCLGDDVTSEGERLYNLLLEFAPGGTMSERVRRCGGKLGEEEVRGFAKQVLRGLAHVHKRGFAHLDIKPDNLLLSETGEVKIADFGLSKRVVDSTGSDGAEIRGTPMYMAPESVNDNEYGPACDVWAVGCSVVEMATGRPAWGTTGDKRNNNMAALLMRIGVGDETPSVPDDVSEEGKDFLRMCFVKDPRMRWTAEMLLDHPFLCGVDEEDVTGCCHDAVLDTPRCVFDFPEEWSTGSWSTCDRSSGDMDLDVVSVDSAAVKERVRRLADDDRGRCEWVDSGSWVDVR